MDLAGRKTPLYDRHVALGARMIEFAGYIMPVQYKGILEEHRTCRKTGGIFDLTHMGEFMVEGPGALETVENLVTNHVGDLVDGQIHYTPMCTDTAGIVDDLLVYKFNPEKFMMVVNAANLNKDWKWLETHNPGNAVLTNRSYEIALIAVQGRIAEPLLAPMTDLSLVNIPYYHFGSGKVIGLPAIVSRTGYTGEDGFEIYCENKHATAIWDALMEKGVPMGLAPVGLGARDTLRLEMKMCLYGNDIDETTNPLEAGLGWTVKLDKGHPFIGDHALLAIKQQGLTRKLVGFEVLGEGIVRHGMDCYTDSVRAGTVTSGTMSPSLNRVIGLAYLPKASSEVGTEFSVDIRSRMTKCVVVKTPFYKRDY